MNHSDVKISRALPKETQQLQELMAEVVHCCQDRMIFESRKFNLPQAEIKCLMLFRGQEQLRVTQIAQGLEVAKSRASTILRSMNERALITTQEDPADGRVKLIGLTRKGKAALAEIDEFTTEVHGAVLAQLDKEQRPMIINSLKMLKQAMDKIKASL